MCDASTFMIYTHYDPDHVTEDNQWWYQQRFIIILLDERVSVEFPNQFIVVLNFGECIRKHCNENIDENYVCYHHVNSQQ